MFYVYIYILYIYIYLKGFFLKNFCSFFCFVFDVFVLVFAILFLLSFQDSVFLCSFDYPGTHSVEQGGLKLIEIHMLLSPGAGIKGVCHDLLVPFPSF